MKKIAQYLTLLFLSLSNVSQAQLEDVLEGFVREGITFHDAGKYDEAIAKYTLAISMDSTYVLAYGERAFSLLMKKEFEACIQDCEHAIRIDSTSSSLPSIYTTYANALDDSGKGDRAIAIYTEAIQRFPDFQMLYFNRGIAFSKKKMYDLSRMDLEVSSRLGRIHPSSHHALGVTYGMLKQNIASILALNYFLMLESNSARSKMDLDLIYEYMNKNVEKTGKKTVTININEDFLEMMTDSVGKIENNFAMTEMILSTSAALDFDRKYKKEKEIDRYIRKMSSIIGTFTTNDKVKSGFGWEYYAPFFVALEEKGHLTTFCYLIHEGRDNEEINTWIKRHQKEVEEMYTWIESWVYAK